MDTNDSAAIITNCITRSVRLCVYSNSAILKAVETKLAKEIELESGSTEMLLTHFQDYIGSCLEIP